MKSRVWTLERQDAVGIFLNYPLLKKRVGFRKNVNIGLFSSIEDARAYLLERYGNVGGFELTNLKINRLLYLQFAIKQ